jgi:hypothetical protein
MRFIRRQADVRRTRSAIVHFVLILGGTSSVFAVKRLQGEIKLKSLCPNKPINHDILAKRINNKGKNN